MYINCLYHDVLIFKQNTVYTKERENGNYLKIPQIHMMAKRVNLISNLSNLSQERRLEDLYSSDT